MAASYNADSPALAAMVELSSPRALADCIARILACCISGESAEMIWLIWLATVWFCATSHGVVPCT